MREWVFAVLLALAGVAVVIGVTGIYRPAAWIIGGVLVAAWSWLVLGEVGTS